MVCARCEAKLKKTSGVAAVDMWGSASDRASQRKVGENKLLSSKARYSPYAPGGSKAGGSSPGAGGKGKAEVVGKCETCKTTVARAGAKFCQGCAYKKGICAQCGKQVLDVRGYKMSSK